MASLLCPSTQPEMPDAVVHAVMDLASGTLQHLRAPARATEALLKSTAPLVPTQILRFSSVCQEHNCGHFDGATCSLARRLVQILPAATDDLPNCSIRTTCRWFQQESRQACLRCDAIVTDQFTDNPHLIELAVPTPPAKESGAAWLPD